MTKAYRNRLMQENMETFRRWADELSEKLTDEHGVEQKIWIVRASCFILRY